MNIDILILTALEIERKAVLDHLSDQEVVYHPETGTDYVRGVYKAEDQVLTIIVARTDQTNVNAALETERALSHFKPTVIFFIGIAGGLKDVNVGDIVIGKDVYGYERGKTGDKMFKPRPQFGASSYALERMAGAYAQSDAWRIRAKDIKDDRFITDVSVLTGTIASGEKVDASVISNLHKHLKQNASHALAIEMEGLGFLEVCRMRPSIESLLLRGISDLVEGKSQMDGIGSQPYASDNVASFAFGLIEHVLKAKGVSILNSPKTEKKKLLEIFCTLYPQGVKQQEIWVRAGGNLSLLSLTTSTGKAQWTEAIRLIERGGGGKDITMESLLESILEDYPANKDVISLA